MINERINDMNDAEETECFHCHITIVGRNGLQLCSECQTNDEIVQGILDRLVAAERKLHRPREQRDGLYYVDFWSDGTLGLKPYNAGSVTRTLIEYWSKDPDFILNVPYRRMASEAAELITKGVI